MNKKLSEEDVKYRYITVALEKAGWRKENISMEYFTDGQILVEGNVVRRGNKMSCEETAVSMAMRNA